MFDQNHKKMHPDDKKNLVIFLIACVGLLIIYDIFVQQPQMEKLEEAKKQAALETPATPSAQQSTRKMTRDEALQGTQRVQIDSDTLTGSINLTGARIDDILLKQYMTEPNGNEMIKLLNPSSGPFSYFGEFGWLSQDPSLTMPSRDTRWQSNGNNLGAGDTVTLQWNNGQGLNFTNEIALDDKYMFTVDQSVRNTSNEAVTVYPFALIRRTGMPEHMTGAYILHEGPIGYIGEELFEVDYDDLDDEENQVARANQGWVGFTDKYWLTALSTGKDYNEDVKYSFTGTPRGNNITNYQTDMMGAPVTLQPGEEITVPVEFFAGPKIVSMLEEYSAQYNIPHFDLAVDFGVLYFLTRPFYEALTWLNGIFGNFAIAILVFTFLLKLAVFPLTQKSFRSFARMRKVAPQMVEIREKYGDDRMKMQQAILELYKKEDVNPVAGCIPILIQMPIFFALYKVFYVNIGMRHEPFWGWIDDMSAMDPYNLWNGFGLLPWEAPAAMHVGAWAVIMCGTLVLQQRLSPPPQDKTQRFMMGLMPFWMTFILAKFPAGLVIYWSWSNTLSILQQYVLLRQEGVRVNIFTRSRSEERLEELIEEGPDVDPKMAAIEHEIADEDEPKEIKPKQRKKKK